MIGSKPIQIKNNHFWYWMSEVITRAGLYLMSNSYKCLSRWMSSVARFTRVYALCNFIVCGYNSVLLLSIYKDAWKKKKGVLVNNLSFRVTKGLCCSSISFNVVFWNRLVTQLEEQPSGGW